MCQHGQTSLGTFTPHYWTAACRELSVSGASVSLGFLARPKGLLLQLLVHGVWDVRGWLFLFGFCYLPFVVVALASFLAAQMFCGFQAGRLEKCTTSEGFIRSSGSWNQGQAY